MINFFANFSDKFIGHFLFWTGVCGWLVWKVTKQVIHALVTLCDYNSETRTANNLGNRAEEKNHVSRTGR